MDQNLRLIPGGQIHSHVRGRVLLIVRPKPDLTVRQSLGMNAKKFPSPTVPPRQSICQHRSSYTGRNVYCLMWESKQLLTMDLLKGNLFLHMRQLHLCMRDEGLTEYLVYLFIYLFILVLL